MNTNELALWLKRVRTQAGLSQDALAERAGVTGAYISQLELATNNMSGKPTVPKLDKLIAITDALKLDLREPLKALGVLSEEPTELTGDEKKAVTVLRVMPGKTRQAALDILDVLAKLEQSGGNAAPTGRPKRPASGGQTKRKVS
jgi:transcriptional regulator with XRE-family HTH domain